MKQKASLLIWKFQEGRDLLALVIGSVFAQNGGPVTNCSSSYVALPAQHCLTPVFSSSQSLSLYHGYPHLTVNMLPNVPNVCCSFCTSCSDWRPGSLEAHLFCSFLLLSCPLNNLQDEPFSLNYCFLILTLQTISFEVEAINFTSIQSPAAPPSSWKTLALGSYTSLSFQLQQTYQEAKLL